MNVTRIEQLARLAGRHALLFGALVFLYMVVVETALEAGARLWRIA